jgi:RES domain-containing protein
LRLAAWRITKRKNAKSAFTGEGARLYGGRWNSPGVPLVYTAQSRSLAVLEMLVHLDSADLLKRYVLFEIRFDDSIVNSVSPAQLPRNWRTAQSRATLRAIGDQWVANGDSAVLRVPSALVAEENNFLLSPRHKDFRAVDIGKPVSFSFDPRLFESR